MLKIKTCNLSFIGFCITSILLLWLTHSLIDFFWILLPTVSLILILLSFTQASLRVSLCSIQEFIVAIGTGIGLYCLFWLGNQIGLRLFPLYFPEQVQLLYEALQPSSLLSWLLLFLIVIPGEEIVWRAVALEKLALQPLPAILLATALYMLSLIFSISPLLLLAALCGGILWGSLYLWKKNILLPLLSHLVFDLLLLVLFPL